MFQGLIWGGEPQTAVITTKSQYWLQMLNVSQGLFIFNHSPYLLALIYQVRTYLAGSECCHAYKVCNALCFPATNWIGLRKLQEFDVSDNRLVELPTVFLYCFKSLNILNVSRNQLKVFPDPWACPLVSHTALSESEAVKAVEMVQMYMYIYIYV